MAPCIAVGSTTTTKQFIYEGSIMKVEPPVEFSFQRTYSGIKKSMLVFFVEA